MSECLFCRIVRKEIRPRSSEATTCSLHRINGAPHALVTRHIATLNDLSSQDDALTGQMIRRAAAIAREKGYADRGFRTVFNTNAEAGQTVFHIHLHLLAGRGLAWPPG